MCNQYHHPCPQLVHCPRHFVPSKQQLLLLQNLAPGNLQATVSGSAYSRDLTKWDPTIFVLLCLNYFLQGGRVQFPRYIHVTRSIIPLLRLKDIPLHMYNHLLVMNQCLGEPGHWFQDTPQEQNPWVLKSLIYSGLVFAYNPHHLSSTLNHL